MGSSKLELIINGKSLFRRIIDVAINSNADKIIVVTGAHPVPFTSNEFECVNNKDWQLGIGSSIKTGLNQLIASGISPSGALFLVADQPYITADHLKSLIDEFQKSSSIVASHYNNTTGVPAIFPQKYFNEILRLRNEQGAKALIEKHGDQLRVIEFPKGEIDLDTPADYDKFNQEQGLN